MNGIHDMGGMHGMGPVVVEKNEPVFHARWEARLVAVLVNAMDRNQLNGDAFRFEIESLPPADYLRVSYYERWIPVLGSLLVKRGLLTPAELASGRAAGRAAAPAPSAGSQPNDRAAATPAQGPRFGVGQRVRAKNIHPVGHTRLPRYIRGHFGTVDRIYSPATFPDTHAHGLGDERQHVYSIKFAGRELWGDQAPAGDSVYVDLWEGYLESA